MQSETTSSESENKSNEKRVYGWFNGILLTIFTIVALLAAQTKFATFHLFPLNLDDFSVADLVRLELGFHFIVLSSAFMLLIYGERYRWSLRLLALFGSALILIFDFLICFSLRETQSPINFELISFFFLHAKIPLVSDATIFIFYVLLVPALVFLGVFLQYRNYASGTMNRKQQKRFKLFGSLMVVGTLLGFVGPVSDGLDEFGPGLSHNAYLYTIKTAFIPGGDEVVHLDGEKFPQKVVTPVSSESADEKLNVAIIVLESVGASVLSHYSGLTPPTTPFLDGLIKDSLLVETAQVMLPHTSKALVAMHCGIEPHLSLFTYEATLGVPVDCMPKWLSQAGYNTAFFQSPTAFYENRTGLVEQMGFAEFYPLESLPTEGFERVNYFGYEDNILLQPSKDWIEKQDTPFLATYLTGTTHHHYKVPEGFEKVEYTENLRTNEYLNTVRYIDQFVQKLMDGYKQAGLYEDTIFVIVGDHGESMCEEIPICYHSNIMHDIALQVPLIIHSPKLGLKGTVKEVMTQASIVSTLAELLGFEIESGKSFPSFLEPNGSVTYASCWYDKLCVSRRDEQYRYVYNFGVRSDELYDLHQDPMQTNNIITEYPDMVEQFEKESLYWYNRTRSRYHNFYLSQDSDYLAHSRETLSNGWADQTDE